MRKLVAGIAVAISISATACGTTVPLSQQVGGVGSTLGDGTSTPGQSAVPGGDASVLVNGLAPSAAGGGRPGTAPGGPGGTSTSAVNGTRRGTPGGTGTGAPGSLRARGVTATTLTIGLAVAQGTDAVANTFGISGAGSVPLQDIMNAVVKDVNASGGVLGRKLSVQVHAFNAADGIANPEKTVAAICADYRDDHKVFAVVFDVTLPSLRRCLAEMGSPLLVLGGFTVMPAAAYRDNGGSFLYGSNVPTTERLAELFIASLLDRSFTAPWDTTAGAPGAAPVKLGVIHVDSPDQNALYADYALELRKHGMTFADTVTYSQNADAALSATQNAILKFRADGITHVFGASSFFLQAAESQKYRPRYAFVPGLGTIGADNSPAAQMHGALTVGWTPVSDVGSTQDPGDNPAAARCRAVMKAANLSTANRADLKSMYGVCDTTYAFVKALTAGQEASVAGLRRGYEGLASPFPTALTFGSYFGPGRHNGVDSVRDMAYDSACSCLKYASKNNRS